MNHRLRILPLCITALFASCSPVEGQQTKQNAVSEYKETITSTISWQECLSQKEEHYLVFFYSDTCPHCHEIMGDVLEFSEGNILKMYFLNTKESPIKIPISSDVDSTIGVRTIEELFIAGTPTILEVEKGVVKDNVPGKDNCLTFLNRVRLINNN